MMGEVLVKAALFTVGGGLGFWLLLQGCSKLGRFLANARETQTTALIPESVDEEFIFAGQPNYAGLRNRTTQLQADEAARAG